MAETRTGDLDLLAQKYLNKGDYLSSEVIEDQLAKLPEKLRSSMEKLFERSQEKSDIKIVARDADLLDLIFQAVVYAESGNASAMEWVEGTIPRLKTDSARELAKFLKKKKQGERLDEFIRWWTDAKISSDRDN